MQEQEHDSVKPLYSWALSMHTYIRKYKIKVSPRTLNNIRSSSPISDIIWPILSIALQSQFAFIEMSFGASRYSGPLQVPAGLVLLALLQLGQYSQPPKWDTNGTEEKHTPTFLHLSLCSHAGLPLPLPNTPPSSGMGISWRSHLPPKSRPQQGQGCFGIARSEAELVTRVLAGCWKPSRGVTAL